MVRRPWEASSPAIPTRPADFDGTDDFIDLVPAGIGAPAQVSVETWVQIDSTKPANGLHFLVTNSYDDLSDGFTLAIDDANRAQFSVGASRVRKALATSSITLSPGTTYHLVATYDGASARLYVNGTERASVAYTDGIGYLAARDLLIGSQRKAFTRPCVCSTGNWTRWLSTRARSRPPRSRVITTGASSNLTA